MIPTLNEAPTIAAVVEHVKAAGIPRVIVVDSASTDGTAAAASDSGAEVHQAASLSPFRAALGKGDAVQRGLMLVESDFTVILDGDINVDSDFIPSLIAPIVQGGKLFSKAAFERYGSDGAPRNGRVTELVARPMLSIFYPELALMAEPLSGQVAAPTGLLKRLTLEHGYGLEVGMLIDIYSAFGMTGLAHPACGRLAHSPQSEIGLGPMATDVMRAVLSRAGVDLSPPADGVLHEG